MRWASLIGAFLTIAATSGQGNDPSCGSPSSLDRVRAIRAQMKVAGALRALPQAPSVTPQLAIERRAGSPFPHFTAVGPPGQVSQLEATADLASGQWAPWLSVSFGTQPLRWMDEGALNTPFRFFRLRSADSEAFNETASTFRLIDAAGVACDLYYHSDLQAIAVVAAGSNLLQIAPSLPVLNDAALTYSNRIQVWVLLENPAPVRSNVLAQAQELKINFPVLLDRNGLAARSVGLTRVGEVALVQPPAFTVAYRGELGQSAPANSTLFGQALAAVNAGQNLSFLRAASAGPLLAHAGEETPEYGRDVAPVLYQYCAPCHRPNGVAPFAMTTHNVVEQWALSIKHALLSGKMPRGTQIRTTVILRTTYRCRAISSPP